MATPGVCVAAGLLRKSHSLECILRLHAFAALRSAVQNPLHGFDLPQVKTPDFTIDHHRAECEIAASCIGFDSLRFLR
jgi:hypothetical protein